MAALAAESATAGGAPEGGAVLLPVLVVLDSVAAYEELRAALVGAVVARAAVIVQSVQDPKLIGAGDVVLVDGFCSRTPPYRHLRARTSESGPSAVSDCAGKRLPQRPSLAKTGSSSRPKSDSS
jgi:hypothetical protein